MYNKTTYNTNLYIETTLTVKNICDKAATYNGNSINQRRRSDLKSGGGQLSKSY